MMLWLLLSTLLKKGKLKIIKVQRGKISKTSKIASCPFGIIWLLSAKMGRYLIRSCLTDAWTT
uniref:Stromal antigen n=1 Tax=Rhizophora mucronata TaxID=61149 RepID=A0A2P2M870_RHIMU